MADEKIIKDEIISDEDLENIAGGSYKESYDQMEFLNRNMGIIFFTQDRDASVNKLGGLYTQAGIRFVAHQDSPNEYYNMINGQPLFANTAFQHLVNSINTWRMQGIPVA